MKTSTQEFAAEFELCTEVLPEHIALFHHIASRFEWARQKGARDVIAFARESIQCGDYERAAKSLVALPLSKMPLPSSKGMLSKILGREVIGFGCESIVVAHPSDPSLVRKYAARPGHEALMRAKKLRDRIALAQLHIGEYMVPTVVALACTEGSLGRPNVVVMDQPRIHGLRSLAAMSRNEQKQ